jgi:hypothetical protein
VRSKLLNLPSRLAPLVAPLTDPEECRAAMDAEMREVLEELSGDGITEERIREGVRSLLSDVGREGHRTPEAEPVG